MNPKLLFVASVVFVCAAQVVACSSDFSSCTESRTCIAEGGGKGEDAGSAGEPPSEASAGKGGARAASGDDDGGEGGAVFQTPAQFGSCSGIGKLACDGEASAQRLACDGSKWQAGTTCASGELCNSDDGKCLPKVVECADARPGQVLCRKDVPLTCGPDLVTVQLGTPCLGVCKDGVCAEPACGDGKIENGEACDDGNVLAGDGCSATCTPEPVALALGNGFSCALGSNGAVKCWGNNSLGQLGQGDTLSRGDEAGELGSNLKPIPLGSKRIAKAIVAGGDSACALLDDRTVKCWGGNGGGQLGTGDTDNRGDTADEMGDHLKPINFGTGRTVTNVSISLLHACAVLDDGTVKCWGTNEAGDLGQDNVSDAFNPGAIPPIALGAGRTAKIVATSPLQSSCALLDSGLLKCWGQGALGQLCNYVVEGPSPGVGNDSGEMSQLIPFAVTAGRTVKSFATGLTTNCALLDDGSVKCWGQNSYGEGGNAKKCGDPLDLIDRAPLDLGVERTAESLSMASEHLCLVLDDGSVRCLGRNASGQLGIGSTDEQGAVSLGALKTVPLPRPALQVATGVEHSCAILDDGLVRCWGLNTSGELGVGDKLSRGDSGGLAGVKLTAVDLKF